MRKSDSHCLLRMPRDERGNVAITFSLMLVPLLGVIGLGIDYSRASTAHARLQVSADAAALAAVNARTSTEQERQTMAIAAFQSNFNPAHPELAPTPTVTIDGDAVTVTASTDVEMTVGSAFGVESQHVSTTSSAALNSSGRNLEVSMMIDLTGSMGSIRNGSTKIAALKLAGQDLLDILYPNGDDDRVRVAVAPFADYVNAGAYAAAATGLASTGTYNNQYNLASTRHGPFSGAYTGSYTGSSSGSQSGATSASSTTAGATFDNEFCADPTVTVTSTSTVYHTGRLVFSNFTWPVAASYSNNWFSGATWGWFWVENYMGVSGRWGYGWKWHTPKTTTTSTTSEVAGCESASSNNGQLVTCVTERTDSSTRYTDEAPGTGKYAGAYNQSANGVTNKVNYSSDGKCYTSGRELPSVIPLTSTKSTLENFFTNATIGGGTPGHLGTAWAWYMLSPNWSSVFPSASEPAAYTDTGTKKFAIIMTDGEYNQQYSSEASRTQALELCTGMKAQGIHVYTIGFGFSTSSVAGSSTAEGKAKETMQNCASDTSSYYFPYDGDALREVFQSIGNTMTDGTSEDTVVISN